MRTGCTFKHCLSEFAQFYLNVNVPFQNRILTLFSNASFFLFKFNDGPTLPHHYTNIVAMLLQRCDITLVINPVAMLQQRYI